MKCVTIKSLAVTGCLVTFFPSLITGLVRFFVLPSGGGKGNSWVTFLGIARTQWVNLHNYTSPAFAALLIIHFLLHGRFYRNIRRTFGERAKEPSGTAE